MQDLCIMSISVVDVSTHIVCGVNLCNTYTYTACNLTTNAPYTYNYTTYVYKHTRYPEVNCCLVQGSSCVQLSLMRPCPKACIYIYIYIYIYTYIHTYTERSNKACEISVWMPKACEISVWMPICATGVSIRTYIHTHKWGHVHSYTNIPALHLPFR